MNIMKIKDGTMTELNGTSFCLERILEEQLRDYIFANPSCLSEDSEYLFVSKEFSPWPSSSRKIDIVGVDNLGRLVVVEVKRDIGASHADLQALRYAAMLQEYKFDDFIRHCGNFFGSEDKAKQAISDFVIEKDCMEIQKDFDNKKEIVIILVAQDFSKELLATVRWLRDIYGIDIRCISFVPYKDVDCDIYVRVEKVIPISEVKIDLWSRAPESSAPKTLSKNYTKFKLDEYGPFSKGRFVYALIASYILDKSPTFDELKMVFPDNIQGSLGVFRKREDAMSMFQTTKYKRYYIDGPDILKTKDGQEIAVCNQWGFMRDGRNMKSILDKAKELGYAVTEVV